MPAFGQGADLLVTGSTHDERGYRRVDRPEFHARLVERINRKVLDRADEICDTQSYFIDDAEVAVVAYGFTARSALAAVKGLRGQGIRAGLLRLVTLWPFPDKAIRSLGEKCPKLLVPEMNRGQVASLVKQHTHSQVTGLCQTNGEVIEPESIAKRVQEVLK
jgi:2-oxoglutarate ferredoxin oxidoreductase subunit alpha